MNNKTFNAKHLDPSFRVVSLRTTRTSLSLRCTRLPEFLPGSPFICALHGFELAQLWCQRLPQEGFIGRCACIIWLITYSIRQTCSECVNYAIKMTLRYYFHLSDWPVFRSFTIGYSWRGYQKKKKWCIHTRLMWIQNGSTPLKGNFAIAIKSIYSFSLCSILWKNC